MLEDRKDTIPLDGLICIGRQALSCKQVDQRQYPEALAIIQLIGDEIHGPAFICRRCLAVRFDPALVGSLAPSVIA